MKVGFPYGKTQLTSSMSKAKAMTKHGNIIKTWNLCMSAIFLILAQSNYKVRIDNIRAFWKTSLLAYIEWN